MTATKTRTAWLDAARGIGIILVVEGHVGRGLVEAGIASGPGWSWSDYSLYTFHMPLLFLLAGVNVPKSLERGAIPFLRGKLSTIVYPYFLWSIIQGSILIALSSMTNGHLGLSDLAAIAWRPMGQFWFLYALFICQLLAAIVVRRTEFLIGLALASVALIDFVVEPIILKSLVFSFPFFALGTLGHRLASRWKPGYDLPASIASAVGFIVAVGVSGNLGDFDPQTLIAIPASVCGITMVITVSRLLSGKALRAAMALGQASMTIYVAHLLVAAGLRIGLVRANIIPDAWIFLVVCTASGIIIPYLGHMALLRLGLLPLLGLGPPARKTASAWKYA